MRDQLLDEVRNVRNVDEHRFVVFVACVLVNESGALPLDLHASARLALDVLDEETLRRGGCGCCQSGRTTDSEWEATHAWADDLCSYVEVAERLEANVDLCIVPRTLQAMREAVSTSWSIQRFSHSLVLACCFALACALGSQD